MSWCPHCDEVFPEGPVCPRCRSPLVELGDRRTSEGAAGANLPQLKVPRRVRRAFDRMNREPAPPRQLMALAMAAIMFAGGFLVGRMGAVLPDQPVLRQLVAAPIGLDLDGVVRYIARPPGPANEPALVSHELPTGQIDTVSRFTFPFGQPTPGRFSTDLIALDGSAAIVIRDAAEAAFVGALPRGRALPLWLEAYAAGWVAPDRLLVLKAGGVVERWTFGADLRRERVPGRWDDILSSPAGAVLLRGDGDGRVLASTGAEGLADHLRLPTDGRIVAVGAGGRGAVLDRHGRIELWRLGSDPVVMRAEGFEARAGAFSPEGDRVALTLVDRDRPGSSSVHLGISDLDGNVAFDRITVWSEDEGCVPTPAWDGSERWVYLSPGDGSVYAAQVGGGAVEAVHTRIVGCGLSWTG